MTPHRALNLVAGALLAIVIGTALSTAHLLDDDLTDEAETAEAVATAQADAQAVARAEEREALLERAADMQCIRMHGASFRHRWTSGGDLVCTDRNGRTAVTVAGSL